MKLAGFKQLSLETLAVFAISAGAMGWSLAGAGGMLGVDGYYHFRVAEEIVRRGPWVDIDWLPFTVLGEAGPDHHWLFHLLISPFTLLGHSLTAVQCAAVFFAALIPAVLTPVCRRLGVPYAPLFALLAVAGASVLPGRYLMLRTHGPALLLMVLALVAMTRQRHVQLGLIAFAFMQLYHGAVMLVPLAAIWLLLQWLCARRFESRVVVAVASGLFLGLVLSPWFPENVGYLIFHTAFKMGQPLIGLVGFEWYPAPWRRLLWEAWPAHLLLLAAVVAVAGVGWRARPQRVVELETLLFLVVAVVFLALYKHSWRFVDYYVPFACIAAGLAFRDTRHLWLRRLGTGAVPVACLALLLLFGTWRGFDVVAKSPKMPPTRYGEIAAHLNAHGEPGEVVLNSHWPDFVQLVWHSPQFVYVSGLDGHYLLYGDDPEVFDFWFALRDLGNFNGKDVGELAVETLGARWMVVPAANDTLAALVQESRQVQQVLHTDDGWLFELRPRAAARVEPRP